MTTTEAAWQRTADRIRNDELTNLLREARDAFRKYEMDVDEPAPCNHVYMMMRIEAALAAAPQPADELAQEFAALKADNERLREIIRNYQRRFDKAVTMAARLRTLLLSEIDRLEKLANAHEGEDFGHACREQAEMLRGEMRDV